MSFTDHFQGKSPLEHLKEARQKGKLASQEVHGQEMPGHLFAFADSAKETAAAILILWTIAFQLSFSTFQVMGILLLFSSAWLIWKTCRSALLGWSRLERLHRLIEEERWEIEHHRHQEREELTELYLAKGFSGKLLEEVVQVLMADDNRLLRVMLEEELGLSLETHVHPLKQALGAAIGVLISTSLALCGYLFNPLLGIPLTALFILIGASITASKLEKNRLLPAMIWNVASVALSCAAVFFAVQLFFKK